MDLNSKLLIIAALLPAIVLCIYVYKKDRVEKEPLIFLIQLFLLGVLCCGPAVVLERAITGAIDNLFSLIHLKTNAYFCNSVDFYYFYNLLYYFVGVALVEEGLKWIVLRFFALRKGNLNCVFDGLIYAVFISLGFAALENVLYVTNYGWTNALTRAVLSVPGHMFFSVMMGYYFSRFVILKEANNVMNNLKNEGLVPENAKKFPDKNCEILSLVIPVLIHGTYNFTLSIGSTVVTVLFLLFIVFLYVISFKTINKMSKGDGYNETYVSKLIYKKFPDLKNT